MSTWIDTAIEFIKNQRIEHCHYDRAVAQVFSAAAVAKPGEVVVMVGPSRVGKSSAVAEALLRAARPIPDMHSCTPTVWVEAENASTDGKFSTKAFMRQCCQSIEHPIYGVSHNDDSQGVRMEQRIQRTPEALLRNAFERGLVNQATKYFVIDEAHHVAYAGSRGTGAVAILDSWKCLAQKTGIILVLVGSYSLLDIMSLTPHLLGRQRPIEFPAYRAEDKSDRRAFRQVLQTYDSLLRFEEREQSLLAWTDYLLEQSFGCVGHLSIWLRSALGRLQARNGDAFSVEALRESQLPANQAHAIVAEMQRGARSISLAEQQISEAINTPNKSRTRAPFQRATKRFALDGRA